MYGVVATVAKEEGILAGTCPSCCVDLPFSAPSARLKLRLRSELVAAHLQKPDRPRALRRA
jgi:hypothetical protein